MLFLPEEVVRSLFTSVHFEKKIQTKKSVFKDRVQGIEAYSFSAISKMCCEELLCAPNFFGSNHFASDKRSHSRKQEDTVLRLMQNPVVQIFLVVVAGY